MVRPGQCDTRHPFSGIRCEGTMWHSGNHFAAFSRSTVTWGFRGDYSDGPDGLGEEFMPTPALDEPPDGGPDA